MGDAPERIRRVFNLVPLIADADGEDVAFDQPCAYGERVGGHAVYCNNEDYPEGPRKCRRGQYADHLHKDCPGYAPNPDYPGPKDWQQFFPEKA